MSKNAPAFPIRDMNDHPGPLGLTIRDYFAAKAMHAEMMTNTVPGESCDALIRASHQAGVSPVYRMAQNAYEMADAMLKAREQ